MRHKYLITSILIIILIIIFQGAFFLTLYDNFRKEFKNNLEDVMFLSIDLEYRDRLYNFSDKLSFEAIDEMSEARRDSLLKIAPIPPAPPKFNVEELIKKDIIRTSSEIGDQYNQDISYDKGIKLNLRKLDSIFIAEGLADYPHTFTLIDSVENNIQLSNQTPLDNYSYKSRPFYIGIQARQTIFIYYDIPLSSFIKKTFLIVVSSILMLLAALILALIQTRIIRQNKKIAQQMRENINGTVHDLKTPLSGVVMALELAKVNTNDTQIKNIFSLSLSSVHHLIGNINSLLSVARENNTLHKQNITTLELLGIVGQIVSDLDNIYANKPHNIEVSNLLDKETMLNVDKLHFENILRNLMDNAVKYADNGVKVKLSIAPIANGIKFTVEDNGYGIPKKYHRKIFKHFYRIEQTAGTQRGYGVGLSQVKQLVEKHGGKISLQSKEGQGTTFTFIIPN